MIYNAADLHLRPRIWSKHPSVEGDAVLAWINLVRIVCKTPGALLILAGDIFNDNKPSGEMEYVFKRGMDALKEKGCRVVFIKGNHDDEKIHRASLFGAEHLKDGKAIEIDGIKIAGINYTRNTEALQAALAEAPVCDYLVMHTAFRHMLGFEDMWQCSYEDVPEQVGAVLTGHIHVPSMTHNVYSPGSTCVNTVAEFDPKHHGYIKIDNGKVTWHQLPGRTFLTFDYNENLKDIIGNLNIPDFPLFPVINIRYRHEEASFVEEVVELFPDYYFLRNAYSDSISDILSTSSGGDSLNLQEVIRTSVNEYFPGQQDRVFTSELINNESPVDILQQYMEEEDET